MISKPSRYNHLEPDEAFSLRALWRVLSYRRATIAWITLAMFATTFTVCLVRSPQYAAESNLEINPENASAVDLSTGTADAESEYAVTLATQANVLASDTLALQVIQQLNLEQVEKQRSHLFFSKRADDDSLPLEQSPVRRTRMLKRFHKNLSIHVLGGTRILQVRCLDRDPALAATIVNTLVNDYLEQYFQTRYTATHQASEWLSRQLAELKNDVEVSQQRLVDYQRQAGILGESETHNVVTAKLEELNKQLSGAEANRIVKQAVWQLAKTGDPELISSIAGSSFVQGVSAGGNAAQLGLLPALRSQEAQLKADIAQTAARLGPAFPKLQHVLQGAQIGERCNVGDHASVESGAVLGDNVTVKNGVSIWDGVTAEDNVFIGPNVVFTNDRNPRAHVKKAREQFLRTNIREGASLGANVTVLCGITVGRYSFAGAGTVLTKDVPDYAVVVGNPGRQVGYMCECGERMRPDLTCPCGLKFAKEGGHVVRVPF
jgi:UDP-2-acetamido-3-amino-2,3-dideoxy-glucuronate N-acetyltransferase